MALTPSGAISLGDINTATGKSSTATITMDGTAVRCISDTNSGTVSMSSLQGKNVAGGTITAAISSSTSKGVTTTRWGRDNQAGTGSTTIGNIATLWPNVNTAAAIPIPSFFSAKASNVSTYSSVLNVLGTSSLGWNATFRLRVHNNNNAVLQVASYVANTQIYSSTAAYNTVQIITANDVGVARDWVFCGLT
jgi:hypothetical protein